jgi:glycosyltransferase involved in cell wall biosynthesis
MTPERSRSGVCVVGRSNFSTGIGQVVLAALELFGRAGDVALFATDRSPSERTGVIVTPLGQPVELVGSADGFATCFFADVLWNGSGDVNHTIVPERAYRIAHIAFDSDTLPPEWVTIANERFDALMVMSQPLEDLARASGVHIPVGTLPVALDIDAELDRLRHRGLHPTIRFGTMSAFHERKNLEAFVEGFALAFGPNDPVELIIHSNLALGRAFHSVRSLVERLADDRVRISISDLSLEEKFELMSSFDVYVNVAGGEGYSIGPREALAQGRPVILSEIPAHAELVGLPGTFLVPAAGRVPARYPEIDNRQFGFQFRIDPRDIARAFHHAVEYVWGGEEDGDERLRRRRAAHYTMTALEGDYIALVDPDHCRPARLDGETTTTHFPAKVVVSTRRAARRHGSRRRRRKLVIQAYDGGFFSLFNSFMSHLAWSLQEPSPPLIVPDWDVTRLMEREAGKPLESYCYSAPGDGNMWLGLFEPLYDLTEAEMNDVEFLYADSELPEARHNEDREPLLTYVHAYDLYRLPWFPLFRRQYHAALDEHVRLRPEFRREVDRIRAETQGGFVISVHVKHPSHAIEQPDQRIAGQQEYFAAVRKVLHDRGIAERSDEWRIFVATDQDRIVRGFAEEFGDRMISFSDVTRIATDTDECYDQLDDATRITVGHQLQHQLAAQPATWSVRLAWEVWRDAEAMAASNVLLHAVSNVSTAVSYMNPRVEMIYCAPS